MRRSGVTLAMWLSGWLTYRFSGLGNGDEHLTYAAVEYDTFNSQRSYMYIAGVLTDNQAERTVSSIGGAETDDASPAAGTHCCLVAIGRLQVTSCPNTSDLLSPSSSTEFISRNSIDGKFTFVDHRFVSVLFVLCALLFIFHAFFLHHHHRHFWPAPLKPGFHYLSSQAELTARELGCIFDTWIDGPS